MRFRDVVLKALLSNEHFIKAKREFSISTSSKILCSNVFFCTPRFREIMMWIGGDNKNMHKMRMLELFIQKCYQYSAINVAIKPWHRIAIIRIAPSDQLCVWLTNKYNPQYISPPRFLILMLNVLHVYCFRMVAALWQVVFLGLDPLLLGQPVSIPHTRTPSDMRRYQ